jgi:hypothetical protein
MRRSDLWSSLLTGVLVFALVSLLARFQVSWTGGAHATGLATAPRAVSSALH